MIYYQQLPGRLIPLHNRGFTMASARCFRLENSRMLRQAEFTPHQEPAISVYRISGLQAVIKNEFPQKNLLFVVEPVFLRRPAPGAGHLYWLSAGPEN